MNLLSNLYMPPWSGKNFKFMVFKLLENTFASQNIKSWHCRPCPLPDKLSSKFLSSPPGLIQMHMTAIKHKKSQVVYTYQLTTKQIFKYPLFFFFFLFVLPATMLMQCFPSLNSAGEQFRKKSLSEKISVCGKICCQNFHQTLQSQDTEVHFFQNRQQNRLSLIGYKTSDLECDKNIYVNFSTESSHLLFLSRIFYLPKHH